jgi:hypothetical protein
MEKRISSQKLDHSPKVLKFSCLFGVIIPLLVIFVDLPLISKNLHFYYIAGRVLTALLCGLIILQVSRRKYSSWHVPLFVLAIASYSIHGQLYLPCYYLAYMETIIPLGLFFNAPKKIFYPVLLVSMAGVILSVIGTPDSVIYGITDPKMISKFKFDAIAGVVITSLVSWMGYSLITTVKRQKEILVDKFLDIGCQSSLIMHDFKNLLTSPLTTVELIKHPKIDDEKKRHLLGLLEKDLQFICSYVGEINGMSKNYEDSKGFLISDVIESVKLVLRKQIQNRKIEIKNDLRVIGNQNLWTKVFYNLIINSVEAGATEIEIGHENGSIYLKDNGKGFSNQKLKSMNSSDFSGSSTKQNGSSIGLLLVKNLIEKHGGHQLEFQNNKEGGALVKLKVIY